MLPICVSVLLNLGIIKLLQNLSRCRLLCVSLWFLLRFSQNFIVFCVMVVCLLFFFECRKLSKRVSESTGLSHGDLISLINNRNSCTRLRSDWGAGMSSSWTFWSQLLQIRKGSTSWGRPEKDEQCL